MPQARDEAGNIWEVDGAGNPVRMVQPASAGRVFTLPPNPKDVRQEQRQNAADARAADAERRANAAEQRAQADFASKNTMVPPPGDVTKTGDDYLATLPPSLAAQVKALSDGRRAFPTGAALRSPSVQELVAAASQYDPTLDAANAATRVATRKDFTSGKAAQNITSMNTALGHLETLAKSAAGLENRSFPLWNTLANKAESATGDPRVSNFRIARDAVANELMKVFRGTGGSLQEVQEWQHAIDSSDSPEQLHAAITKATELLNSRLQAVGDQYNRGMGKSGDPMQLLAPHAQHAFDTISASHTLADILAASPTQKADNELPGPPTGGGDKPPPTDPSPPDMPPTNGDKFVATGNQRTTYDARTSSQIDALISAGASKATVDAVLKRQSFPIVSNAEWSAIQKWRNEPSNQGKKYTGANISRTDDLNLGQRAAASAPAAFVARLANAGTAGAVGAFSGEQGQGALDAMGTLHPDSTPFADVIGGVGGALGTEAMVATRAPAWLAKAAPHLANAIYGGALGFNTAREGDGAWDAAKGAGLALLGGAAGHFAGKGIGALTTLGKGSAGYISPAERSLYGTVKGDFSGAQTMLNDAQDLNLPTALADADPRLRTLAGAVTRKSVNARNLAEQTFDPRNMGQAERAVQAVNTHLAPVGDVPTMQADILKTARTQSNPLYEAAKAEPVPELTAHPDLKEVLDRPAGQAAIRNGYETALNKGEDVGTLTYATDPNGNTVAYGNPSWNIIHYARQALDKSGETDVRHALDRQITTLNSGFKQADAVYSTAMKGSDALQAGADATGIKVTPEATQRALAGYPNNLPQFQQGYASNLADQIERQRLSGNPYSAVYGSPAQQAKVSSVFPQGADAFGRVNDIEREMAKTRYETLGGSPTAGRLQADDQLGGGLGTMALDVGSHLATGGGLGLGSLIKLGVRAMGDSAKLGVGKAAVRRADELAPQLFDTSDPAAVSAYLDDLIARSAVRSGRKAAGSKIGGWTGAGALAPLFIGN